MLWQHLFLLFVRALINLNNRNYKCILSPGDYKKDSEKRTFPFSLTYELALSKGILSGHSLGIEQVHLGSQFYTGLSYGGSSPHLGNPDPPPGHSDSMELRELTQPHHLPPGDQGSRGQVEHERYRKACVLSLGTWPFFLTIY